MELFFPVMRYKRYCFRGIRNLSVEIFRIISAFIIIILQVNFVSNTMRMTFMTLKEIWGRCQLSNRLLKQVRRFQTLLIIHFSILSYVIHPCFYTCTLIFYYIRFKARLLS